MNKLIALLLAVVMCLSLCACRKSKTVKNEENESPNEATTQLPTIAEPVSPTEAATELSTNAPTEVSTEPPRHAEGSAPYLKDIMSVNSGFGVAQYSVEEIRAMKNYSAAELQGTISTVADMVQYIVETDFGDNPLSQGSLEFTYKNLSWCVNKSPQGTLDSQSNSCGAIANLVRYVLEDDYDEEGYIHWKDFLSTEKIPGGHVVNYFKSNDTYLILDFTQIRNDNLDAKQFNYVRNLSSYVSKLLSTRSNPSLALNPRWAIYIERDVHHDHAPAAFYDLTASKFTLVYDESHREEIEFLHLDEEWLNSRGTNWITFSEPFQNIGLTIDMVPSWLIN